jgi:hypothetical protein
MPSCTAGRGADASQREECHHLYHPVGISLYSPAVTSRIATRSKRQALDWSLALVSQDILATLDHHPEAGWGLLVEAEDHARAR